jgi:hydrogenase nickel incorporation protein HypA/HybF
MHEVSVVATLVDAILKELEKYKVVRVNSVTLRIGDLTNLGEEQMSFAYEIVTRGTMLEGSELIVEHEPIELQCKSCGYAGPAKVIMEPDFDSHAIPILACPECGGPVIVTSGQSCTVRCMDIEEEERCSNTGTNRLRRRSLTTSRPWTSMRSSCTSAVRTRTPS